MYSDQFVDRPVTGVAADANDLLWTPMSPEEHRAQIALIGSGDQPVRGLVGDEIPPFSKGKATRTRGAFLASASNAPLADVPIPLE